MNLHEVLGFLFPNIHDHIQITFFSIIFLLMTGTIIYLWTDTGPGHWQTLWRSTQTGDSDTDQSLNSSLGDLQATVRTKGEKLADAMPGIVLVIGLLGTFLGLGIALNKASQILAGANAGSMDHAMADLMGMMEGLGVKFKTSTWGIIAFLALRTVSGLFGYETRRTEWCAARIQTHETAMRKEILEERKQLNQFLEQIRDQGLTQIDFSQRSQNHSEKLLNVIENNTEQLGRFIESSEKTLDDFARSTEKMARAAEKNDRSAENLQNTVETFSHEVTKILGDVKQDLKQTIEQVGTNLKESTGELSAATEKFSQEMTEALDDMKAQLGKSIKEMEQNFTELTQEIGTEMKDGSEKIAGAVDGMSDKAREMMEGFDERAEKTQKSVLKIINEFTKVSTELREQMKDASTNAEKTIGAITEGLKAVSEFQIPLRDAVKNIGNIANQLSSQQHGGR